MRVFDKYMKSADLRSSVLELFEYRCLHIFPTLRVDSDVFGRSCFPSSFVVRRPNVGVLELSKYRCLHIFLH